jgi:hypothetical protein
MRASDNRIFSRDRKSLDTLLAFLYRIKKLLLILFGAHSEMDRHPIISGDDPCD